MRSLTSLGAVLLLACSADPFPPGHYKLITGQETDTLTRAPAPGVYKVISVDSSNTARLLSTSSEAPDTIDVGLTGTYNFIVQGFDGEADADADADAGADGRRRVAAASYAIGASGMANRVVPLFEGRTDAFCRPPGALAYEQGTHPAVGLVNSGQLLWIAGASSNGNIVSEGYNLVDWQPTSAPGSFATLSCSAPPCHFQSFATYGGSFALGIGPNWAFSISVADGSTADVPAPTGLSSWADVAGGRSILASTGAVYLVGATRTNSATATSAVVEWAIDGLFYARSLTASRINAAAAWIADKGLLVVGGSGTAAGAEWLTKGTTTFAALPYPPDSVTGAALVSESATSSKVWRVGGRNTDGSAADTVVYDISRTQNSAPDPVTALNIDVTTATGFSYNGNRIVVGEQEDGTMVAFRITDTSVELIPLREPRRSASVIELPNGFVALVGGTLLSDGTTAKSLELVAY